MASWFARSSSFWAERRHLGDALADRTNRWGRGRLRQWPSADACGRGRSLRSEDVARVAWWFGLRRDEDAPDQERPHRDLDLPRLDPRFVPQKSTAVGCESGAIGYPTAPRPVLNQPLAEPVRGFCKQAVRGSSPLASTPGQRVEALGRDGQDALDQQGVLGMA